MIAQDVNLTRNNSAVDGTDDREARPRFWIAAYTKSKSERKAAKELEKINIETYVPVQNVIHQWSDRKKKIDKVVIPMIIFAHISAEDILLIKKQRLIHKILSFPGQKEPAHIPEDQILNLRLMLDKAEKPVEFVKKSFNLSDKVRVIKGHLAGLVGKVERIEGGRTRLVVSIDMLGGAMVEINSSDLENITPKIRI